MHAVTLYVNIFCGVIFVYVFILKIVFLSWKSKQNKHRSMVIYGVYIVSKSGGLIFNHDHNIPKVETEKVFSYPIDLTLDYDPKRVSVAFGQKDGING